MKWNEVKKGDKFLVIRQIPEKMIFGGSKIEVNSILVTKDRDGCLGYFLDEIFISHKTSENGMDLLRKSYISLMTNYNTSSENSEKQKLQDSNLYCSCKEPELIKNNAGGDVFDFCKICKKEYKSSKSKKGGLFFNKEDRLNALAHEVGMISDGERFHLLDKNYKG